MLARKKQAVGVFWSVEFKELGEDADRVVQQHYRNIESFVVDDPAAVIPGMTALRLAYT